MSVYTWPEFHGAMTHFPIAFLIGVLLFELGAVIFKKPEWRVVSFWLLVGAVVASVPTLLSGWRTGISLYGSTTPLPPIVGTHRTFAFATSIIALLLLAWRVAVKDRLAGGALAMTILLAAVVAGTVSYTGFLGGKMVFGGGESSSADNGPSPAKTSSAKMQVIDPALIISGQKLYASNACSGCHQIDDHGGKTGPDLTHEARRHNDVAWQIAHLQDPTKISPGSIMPPYNSLPQSDLKALAAYMASRQ